MRLTWIAFSGLALSMGTSGVLIATASAAPLAPSPSAFIQDRDGGWDAPPGEFREIQRQGFHDGIEGARKDFDNHRPPNVNNREEYRHPHVSASARDDYREGFRRGYDAAMRHLNGPQ
ncbi:MAG: hypothetical protein ABSE46_14380 [Terracidiphilus sp.]